MCIRDSGYAAELDYFLNLVRTGRRPEKVTVTDAIVTTEICEAEEKSVISGKIVGL